MSLRSIPLLLALAAAPAASAEEEATPLAASLPADAWVALELPDVPRFVTGLEATSLGRFLADEEVADFLSAPLGALGASLADRGLPTFADLEAAGPEAVLLALLAPGDDDSSRPVPVVGFRTARPLPLELPDGVVESAHGRLRVVAPAGVAERLRAGPRLSDAEGYRNGRAATGAGPRAPFLHVDLRALTATMRSGFAASAEDREPPALPAFTALSWTADVAGLPARTRTHVAIDPEDANLRAVWPDRPFDAETLRLVPRDARGFQFACVDLRAASRVVESIPGASTRDGSAELLAQLDSTIGVVLLPSHAPTAPSLVFVAALRSAGAAERIARDFAGSNATTVEIGARTVHRVPVGLGLSFSLTEVDGWLLGGAEPTALRRVLDHLDSGGPSILDRDDVAAALDAATAQDRPVTGCSWVDVPALAASGLELAGPLLPMLSRRLPIDPSLLPVPEVATETLVPTFAVGRTVGDGLLFERDGPLGADLLGFGALFGVGMVGALARTVEERIEPRIAHGRIAAARASVRTIKEAVTLYMLNNNRLPDSLEVLTAPDPNNDGEPYLEDAEGLIDPWGNPYVYTQEGSRRFTIVSRGADGLPGGEGEDADVTSRRAGGGR